MLGVGVLTSVLKHPEIHRYLILREQPGIQYMIKFIFIIYTSPLALQALLRPWAMWMYRKMTKAFRMKLNKRLLRKGGQLVRKYLDKHGRTRVSVPYWSNMQHVYRCNLIWNVLTQKKQFAIMLAKARNPIYEGFTRISKSLWGGDCKATSIPHGTWFANSFYKYMPAGCHSGICLCNLVENSHHDIRYLDRSCK